MAEQPFPNNAIQNDIRHADDIAQATAESLLQGEERRMILHHLLRQKAHLHESEDAKPYAEKFNTSVPNFRLILFVHQGRYHQILVTKRMRVRNLLVITRRPSRPRPTNSFPQPKNLFAQKIYAAVPT